MSRGRGKVLTEDDFGRRGRPDPGIVDDLFAYVTTDDEGFTGVCYYETASGQRMALVAETEAKARSMQPIVKHLSTVMDRPITLLRFSHLQVIEITRPEPPAEKP